MRGASYSVSTVIWFIFFQCCWIQTTFFPWKQLFFFLLWLISASIHSSSYNEHPPKMFTFSLAYCTVAPELLIWHWIGLECKGVAVSISGPSHTFHLYQCPFIFPLPVTLNPIIKQAGQVSHIHPFQLTSCLPLDSGIQRYLWIMNGSQQF